MRRGRSEKRRRATGATLQVLDPCREARLRLRFIRRERRIMPNWKPTALGAVRSGPERPCAAGATVLDSRT
jgi:hypothetical protein